jgi:uncharacterized membrane protein YkoI
MNLGRPLAYLLCAASSGVLSAGESTTVIPYAQLAPAVQKGIQAQLGNGTIGEIERDEEDGEVTYTVEITRDRRARDYTLNEEGTLVSVEVTLSETPLPVYRSIQAQIGSGTLESIDKALGEKEVRYDVDWKSKDGTAQSFSVLESGKLDTVQVKLEEIPTAVQATIGKEVGQGKLQDIVKSFEDNAVFYDVTVNRAGVDRDFTVADGGKLESRQVFLTEIPAPAQATIQRTMGAGKLLRIDQVFDKKKGVFPFEVEGLVDGKPYDFSVGPKGLFLGVDP